MFYVYMLWTFYVRFTYPYHGYVTKWYFVSHSFFYKEDILEFSIFINLCKYNCCFFLCFEKTWSYASLKAPKKNLNRFPLKPGCSFICKTNILWKGMWTTTVLEIKPNQEDQLAGAAEYIDCASAED